MAGRSGGEEGLLMMATPWCRAHGRKACGRAGYGWGADMIWKRVSSRRAIEFILEEK